MNKHEFDLKIIKDKMTKMLDMSIKQKEERKIYYDTSGYQYWIGKENALQELIYWFDEIALVGVVS